MDEDVKCIYLCYLCKNMGSRLDNILKLVKNGGRIIFDTYGTDTDSISAFLKKCDASGVNLYG